MLVQKIETHVQDALARLMQQYQGKPYIQALITALVQQIQDLEEALFDMDADRQIYSAFGAQLDALGTLVGFPRNGLSDTQYLYFILGQIGENFSDGTIDKVISIFSNILNTPIVHERDLYPAAVGMSAGATLDPALYTIVQNMIQNSLGAGISLTYLALFDETKAFAFDGPAGEALGFDSVTDPDGLGGGMAYIIYQE